MSAPVYVEHCNPHVPAKVRRYPDMPSAVAGVMAMLRLGTGQPIEAAFAAGRAYWYGDNSWRVVVADEFRARAEYDRQMCDRMDAGVDVDDLQG